MNRARTSNSGHLRRNELMYVSSSNKQSAEIEIGTMHKHVSKPCQPEATPSVPSRLALQHDLRGGGAAFLQA